MCICQMPIDDIKILHDIALMQVILDEVWYLCLFCLLCMSCDVHVSVVAYKKQVGEIPLVLSAEMCKVLYKKRETNKYVFLYTYVHCFVLCCMNY